MTVGSEKVKILTAVFFLHSANCFAEWCLDGWVHPVPLGHHRLAEQQRELRAGSALRTLESPSLGSSERDRGGNLLFSFPKKCSRPSWGEGGAVLSFLIWGCRAREGGPGRAEEPKY